MLGGLRYDVKGGFFWRWAGVWLFAEVVGRGLGIWFGVWELELELLDGRLGL